MINTNDFKDTIHYNIQTSGPSNKALFDILPLNSNNRVFRKYRPTYVRNKKFTENCDCKMFQTRDLEIP